VTCKSLHTSKGTSGNPTATVSSKSGSRVDYNKQGQTVTLQKQLAEEHNRLGSQSMKATNGKSARHRSSIFSFELLHKKGLHVLQVWTVPQQISISIN
jgi:hypothetical protein